MLPSSPPPLKVKPSLPPKRVSSLGKPIVASVKNTTHVPANKNTENSVTGISEAGASTEINAIGISEVGASTEINAIDIAEVGVSTEINATGISEAGANAESNAAGISEVGESGIEDISKAGKSKHSENTTVSDLETKPCGRLVRKPVTYSISKSIAYNRPPALYTGEPVPVPCEESSQSPIRSDTPAGKHQPLKRVNVLPSSQSGTAARSSYLTGALLSSQLGVAHRFSHPTSAPFSSQSGAVHRFSHPTSTPFSSQLGAVHRFSHPTSTPFSSQLGVVYRPSHPTGAPFSSRSGTVHRSSRPSGRPLSSQQRPVHYLPSPQNAVHPPHQEGKDRQHVRRVDVPPSCDSPLKFKLPKDDSEQK